MWLLWCSHKWIIQSCWECCSSHCHFDEDMNCLPLMMFMAHLVCWQTFGEWEIFPQIMTVVLESKVFGRNKTNSWQQRLKCGEKKATASFLWLLDLGKYPATVRSRQFLFVDLFEFWVHLWKNAEVNHHGTANSKSLVIDKGTLLRVLEPINPEALLSVSREMSQASLCIPMWFPFLWFLVWVWALEVQ